MVECKCDCTWEGKYTDLIADMCPVCASKDIYHLMNKVKKHIKTEPNHIMTPKRISDFISTEVEKQTNTQINIYVLVLIIIILIL